MAKKNPPSPTPAPAPNNDPDILARRTFARHGQRFLRLLALTRRQSALLRQMAAKVPTVPTEEIEEGTAPRGALDDEDIAHIRSTVAGAVYLLDTLHGALNTVIPNPDGHLTPAERVEHLARQVLQRIRQAAVAVRALEDAVDAAVPGQVDPMIVSIRHQDLPGIEWTLRSAAVWVEGVVNE